MLLRFKQGFRHADVMFCSLNGLAVVAADEAVWEVL